MGITSKWGRIASTTRNEEPAPTGQDANLLQKLGMTRLIMISKGTLIPTKKQLNKISTMVDYYGRYKGA